MGAHDNKIHKGEVKEAYRHLLLEIVPKLAQKIDENTLRDIKNLHFPILFHEMGVNLRFFNFFFFF